MARNDPMREAAEWFVALSRTTVSVEALHEFSRWRKRRKNAEAYRAVETAWRAAAELDCDPDLLAEASSALGEIMARPES
jgi:ferric-dicitrate binding protein FerR (iron transport regulator)